MNSKNRYELEELNINDRIGIIIEVRRVLTKRNLMHKLEDKFQTMQLSIDIFKFKFDTLIQKRLPSPLLINDKLMTQEDYDKKLREVAKNQVKNVAIHNTSKHRMPSSKVLYQALWNLFYLQHEVKHLFVNKPTFAKYIEADEVFRKFKKNQLPNEERWKQLTNLL